MAAPWLLTVELLEAGFSILSFIPKIIFVTSHFCFPTLAGVGGYEVKNYKKR